MLQMFSKLSLNAVLVLPASAPQFALWDTQGFTLPLNGAVKKATLLFVTNDSPLGKASSRK